MIKSKPCESDDKNLRGIMLWEKIITINLQLFLNYLYIQYKEIKIQINIPWKREMA